MTSITVVLLLSCGRPSFVCSRSFVGPGGEECAKGKPLATFSSAAPRSSASSSPSAEPKRTGPRHDASEKRRPNRVEPGTTTFRKEPNRTDDFPKSPEPIRIEPNRFLHIPFRAPLLRVALPHLQLERQALRLVLLELKPGGGAGIATIATLAIIAVIASIATVAVLATTARWGGLPVM